ncbi:MAG: hypothetical protein M3N41_02300 [Acidobacteriota bacterium]|nr:hypothetical protein [Acidobacteriota bacterium]
MTRLTVLLLLLTTGQVWAQAPPGTTGVPPPEAIARLMLGLEQTAAGSAAPVQKAALGLFFSEPLSARLSTWGDLRLSSIPVVVQSTLATLPADATKIATSRPLNQLVRSGEFLVGVSYRILGAKSPWSSLSLLASEGAAMPLAPAGNRFYRQYYGGVRVQSTQHTHMVDVSLGQNEAITGGTLHGMVMRVDGFYALPVTGGNFLYLFGTVMVRASPRPPSIGDPGVDSYRLGVGVDVIQMLKALRTN